MGILSGNETDANASELSKVEQEVVENLKAGFVKLDSLETERGRLQSVEHAIEEEKNLLADESMTEKDSISRLLKIRAVKDVMAARLIAAERRVNEQRFSLLEAGSNVRRKPGNLLYHVRTARTKRATAVIEDLFGSPVRLGAIGITDLVHRVKFVRDIEQALNRISTGQNIDQQTELDTLRQMARPWFLECQAIVLAEPEFSLQDYLPKQEPGPDTTSEIYAEADAVAA